MAEEQESTESEEVITPDEVLPPEDVFLETEGEIEPVDEGFADASIHGIITDGILHTETTLFNQCRIIRNRVDRLSTIIDELETSITTDDHWRSLPYQEKLELYQMFHKVNADLMVYMQNIHRFVADMAKFDSVRRMMNDAHRKVEDAQEKLDNPKVRNVIDVITQMIGEQTDANKG